MASVSVTVERPGRYWAGGQLWGGDGGNTPIAFSQHPLGFLPAGVHRVELLFGGQIIRDGAIDGPYVIRNIHLNQVDSLPPQQAQVVSEATTPPFRASEFGG
jgi:hypothetical protein